MNGAPKLKALYDIMDFLSALKESEDVKIWSRLLEKIAAALGAEAATYFYFDTKAQKLMPFYSLGVPPEKLSRRPIALGEGLCGWVAKFREPVLTADAASDKRSRRDIDGTPDAAPRSIVAVPLFDRLDFSGVLEFLNKPEGFSPDDLEFAQAACQRAALDIRRLRLEEMVGRVTAYNASILDNLSGGFLAVDLQGRLMICNPAARRILAIMSEVTDLPIEKALPELPELADVLRRTLTSKQIVKRQELSWTHADENRLLGYSTLLIQDAQGRFTGAGVTFQDLTQLKK